MVVWLTDRSRMANYGDCRRLRYLTNHYQRKGLQRKSAALPLINGDFVHRALAALLTHPDDLDGTINTLKNAYRAEVQARGLHGIDNLDFVMEEQLCLVEGLVRAWHQVRLPILLAEFDIIDVEREVQWEMAKNIVVMLRFDAVLKRKRDGMLFIKDFKTLGSTYDDFAKKYEHDTQVLCYALAAEAVYHQPVGGLLMEGLIKGRRAIEKSTTSPFLGQRIQQSSLCYAYRSTEKTTGLPIYEMSWSRGAEKVPVWEMKGGIEKWLEEFPSIDVESFFLTPPAIRPARRDMESWQRQMSYQEGQLIIDVEFIERLREDAEDLANSDYAAEAWGAYELALDQFFPQNRNHCFRYGTNNPCSMLAICDTEEIFADPIGSDLYETRVPHHATEEDEAA